MRWELTVDEWRDLVSPTSDPIPAFDPVSDSWVSICCFRRGGIRVQRGRWSDTYSHVKEEQKRPRGGRRISSKHQITIPAEALRAAGLEAGERVRATAAGPGRVVLEREQDVVDEFAGALTGTYRPEELADLRDEWE